MIPKVRSGFDAVAHAAERVGDDLREGASIRSVGPQLRTHHRKRCEHDELNAAPKPKFHVQAPRGVPTKGAK